MESDIDRDFFDIVLYLLTSSRVAIDEPKRYGSYRLFEAFRKLLEIRAKLKEIPADEIYEKLRSEIDRHREAVNSSSKVETNEYREFLDRLIEIMADEVERKLEKAS